VRLLRAGQWKGSDLWGGVLQGMVRIEAFGPKVPQAVPELLAGGTHGGSVDAHAVQPYYTGLLARACRMDVAAVLDGADVVITAKAAG